MTEPTLGAGVTLADYQSWRHHPVSKVFLGYLADYATAIERDVVGRWKTGANLNDQQEALGRVRTCLELSELDFQSMLDFYSQPDEPTELML